MSGDLYRCANVVFQNQGGYAKAGDLTSVGIHSTHIRRLETEGYIRKIKRGLYRWTENDTETSEEFVEVAKIVPNGIICLLSALSYHEITTYQPWEYYVAIHRDASKVKLPEYPPIKMVFFSEAQYRVGISEVDINGSKIKVYDVEKTLCDCARYQNKIGKDVVNEGFKTYLRTPSRDIKKLMDYAQITRVKSIVSQYVEVLL